MIAAELHIGNWIDKQGYYFQVESIDEYGVNVEISTAYGHTETDYGGNFNGIFKEQNIEGIPLTADILERAGFVNKTIYTQVGGGWTAPQHAFFFEDGDGYWPKTEDAGRIISCIELKYLHQLQNLYFALCGEELTINLLSESVK